MDIKKSRIPILNNRRRHIITTTVSTKAAAAVTVSPPLSKFDNKKNNQCSRMAQEAKNYNNLLVNKNKPFSSSSFSSFSFTMNNKRKFTSSLPKATTIKTKIAAPTKKVSSPPSSAPATLRSRIPAAAAATAASKKSNITTATAATPKRVIPTPKPAPKPALIRKSPITQLKEDLEKLRRKKQDDECLIKKQTEEIMKLKKKLDLKNALKSELLETSKIQNNLESITVETKSLSMEVVDLLEVKKNKGSTSDYQDEIKKLQTQLETQEEDYQKQRDQQAQILSEIDLKIQAQQTLSNQLNLDHATQIAQLNSIHVSRINKLNADYEQDLANLKDQFTEKPLTNTNKELLVVDDVIEKALLEFEQEQYNHPAPLIQQQQQQQDGLKGKIDLFTTMNQQWYTKNYMPVEALSWPAPQPLSNLRKLQR